MRCRNKAVIAAGLALLAGPALAQGMLDPQGPVAAAERDHLLRVTAVTMIAIVPVLIGVPLMLWRYRRSRRAAYAPNFEFSAPLEFAMWGVPIAITVSLAMLLWNSVIALDPYRPLGNDPLQVQVIGLDWKWLFLYPEAGVASIGTLAIPAGRPVQLKLTTDTVMQSFMVPSLAGQVYAMPGMVTDLNLMADAPGEMVGNNTQFNGTGFSGQTITVQAMDEAGFAAWLAQAGNAPALDAAGYALLAAPGSETEAVRALGTRDRRLRLIEPQLFQQVVTRYHQGQPVPPEAQPGAPGYRAAAAALPPPGTPMFGHGMGHATAAAVATGHVPAAPPAPADQSATALHPAPSAHPAPASDPEVTQ